MTERSILSTPTTYLGTTFRSKLEAQWAVAFKLHGLKYLYEPKPVSTDFGDYLPDFLVYPDTVYEVKPTLQHYREENMPRLISFQLRHPDLQVRIIAGAPRYHGIYTVDGVKTDDPFERALLQTAVEWRFT